MSIILSVFSKIRNFQFFLLLAAIFINWKAISLYFFCHCRSICLWFTELMSVLYLSHLHTPIFKPQPSLVLHFPPFPINTAATQEILVTQSLKKSFCLGLWENSFHSTNMANDVSPLFLSCFYHILSLLGTENMEPSGFFFSHLSSFVWYHIGPRVDHQLAVFFWMSS